VRTTAALVAVLALAAPAVAAVDDGSTFVRTCRSSAHGDLGRDWRREAVVAGRLAFVGMGRPRRAAELEPVDTGRATPLKVLVVVEPGSAPTVTIAPASRGRAALGYNPIRHDGSGRGVPLADGTTGVRFVGCRAVASREPWNRGTQFPGYFLVARAGCVRVEVQTQGTVLRRTLPFGVARCG
jgi:hypothetical protein